MYYNSKSNNPILNEIRNSLVDKAISLVKIMNASLYDEFGEDLNSCDIPIDNREMSGLMVYTKIIKTYINENGVLQLIDDCDEVYVIVETTLEGIADIVEWLTECVTSSIEQYLEEKKRDFDLEGCEITDEDVQNTIGLILKGYSAKDAVETILNGIYNTLNED